MDDLHAQLRTAAASAFEGTGVAFAYLFGSRARGAGRPDSDVDVAVYLDGPDALSVESALDLTRRLADRSGIGGIEILILNEAPLRIAADAIRTGVVVYSRSEPVRVFFESKTLREFFDFDFHAAALDRRFLSDMAEGRR